jgi:hypothetical protein
MAAVLAPLHTVWLVKAATAGVGLTMMVNAAAVPVQPLAEGVTVMLPVSGADVPLMPVKAAMLPKPDAPRPMEVLLLAHE